MGQGTGMSPHRVGVNPSSETLFWGEMGWGALGRGWGRSTPQVYSALNLPRAPWGVILGERGQPLSPLTPCVYLSLPQAPEHLLPHMAELKKELLALRAQLSYKSQALASLQQRQGTDVQDELSPWRRPPACGPFPGFARGTLLAHEPA